MSRVQRVLVIGLDGATLDLLEPWATSGVMPELGRLMAGGCYGELTSTLPPLTAPAWASLMTGKNPGKHGIFGFRGAPNGYTSGPLLDARNLRARTLWDIIGASGLTIGTIGVVPSWPVRPVNGFMVACMLAPPGAKDIVYPPELGSLLASDYLTSIEPPQPFISTDPAYRTHCLAYLAQVRRMGEQRLEATLRLMRARPCDVLITIFYEPDRIQHRFWRHLTDAGPADVDPAIRQEIVEKARAVYRKLDTAIGEIVRASGPGTVTLLVSDHGFGLAAERHVFVNRWLAENGFLHVRRDWRLRRKVVKRLPSTLRQRFDTIEHIFVNWSRSYAWSEALETRSAGIWLNVEGRQPQGRVRAGAEYERLRGEILEGLSTLRDGHRPVFRLVARREEVYRGPMMESAPDLLVYANPSHMVVYNGLRPELRAQSPFLDFQENGYTGAHNPAGMYVMAGPDVAPLGRQPPKPIEAVAPTVLSLLGLPVPDGMDAPPLLEFLAPEARDAIDVRYAPDVDPVAPSDADSLSEADQAQVEARLRALGYIE